MTDQREPPNLTDVVTRTGVVAWSVVGIMVLLWGFLLLLGTFQVLLGPLVLATVLLYILNPMVTRLHARGLPRILGTLLAFLTLIGGLVLLGFVLTPTVRDQGADLGTDLPTIYEDATEQIEELVDSVGFSVTLWSYDEVEEFVNDPENQDQFLAAAWDRLGAVTSGVLEAVLVFFLAPVVAFYLLIDLPRVRRETLALVPERHRDEVRHVAGKLGSAVGGFLRGQVLVALIVGVMMSFGFWLIGLEFWLIVGMIAGFLNIVPFVGPWVGGILGISVGLLTDSVTTAFWAGVVALAVQQVDNNFVSPTVLRATVRLHPAVVLLVLVLGGALGGLWGVLLAVPATATLKIVGGHLWRTRVLGQSWEEAAEALVVEPVAPGRRGRGDGEEDGSSPVEDPTGDDPVGNGVGAGPDPPSSGDETGGEGTGGDDGTTGERGPRRGTGEPDGG